MQLLPSSILTLQQQFASFPGLVWAKSSDLKIVWLNDGFVSFMGAPSHHFLGKTPLEVFPREIALLYEARDRRVMEARAPMMHFERINDVAHLIMMWPLYFHPQKKQSDIQGVAGFALPLERQREKGLVIFEAIDELRGTLRLLENSLLNSSESCVPPVLKVEGM